MLKPKYSFIIPAYNARKTIKKCIDSIVVIPYREIEIIVVNDGSTDGMEKIINELQQLDNRIKLFSISNSGVSKARNFGIEKSTGDYIFFCDADDYLFSEKFEIINSLIVRHKPDVLLFGYIIDYKIKKYKSIYKFDIEKLYESEELFKENGIKIIKDADFLNVWHMAVSSNIAKVIKFDQQLKYGEDTLFVLNSMLEANSILFSDVCFYNYLINTCGTIGNISPEKLKIKVVHIVKMYQKQKSIFKRFDLKISDKIVNDRCLEMIRKDLEKLYFLAQNKETAEIWIRGIMSEVEDKNLRENLNEWFINQKKHFFWIGKLKIKLKNKLKNILL